jgi:hypothetical protein
MLISATFGFMIGEALGGQARLRKYLEQANEDLRDELDKDRECHEPLRRLLEQQRYAINDIHNYLLPVSKGFENPAS